MLDTYWGHQLVDGITWNEYQDSCSTTKVKERKRSSIFDDDITISTKSPHYQYPNHILLSSCKK